MIRCDIMKGRKTEEKEMDIRLLRYFLAAAREENITRAAETLHIAQPSLSKQLMEQNKEAYGVLAK